MNLIERHQNRMIGIWLLVCCAVLISLILLGGATRLTGSGLSMVEWQPVTGFIPPTSEADWMREFDAYRQSPEYREVNRGMSLDEFKVIYWFEFGHRLLARSLGLIFALPLAWFWWRGMVPRRLRWPLLGLLGLGALQGYMGWFMVQSGLVDIPRVSPYRLAAHLTLALLIFSIMLRLALRLLWPGAPRRERPVLRRWTLAIVTLVAVTILSGAFVAGLRAGLVYNDFPRMAGQWIPDGILGLEPLWRNFFENTATVQFIHRILALSTLGLVGAAWLRMRSGDPVRPAVRKAFHALFALALVQVTLGITTLMLYVPVVLGTLHQGVAVLVLGAALVADDLVRREGGRTEAAPSPR
ncbi:MAG: COX15/CtaA family protein, partial [Wenzhouxiangella sp.]